MWVIKFNQGGLICKSLSILIKIIFLFVIMSISSLEIKILPIKVIGFNWLAGCLLWIEDYNSFWTFHLIIDSMRFNKNWKRLKIFKIYFLPREEIIKEVELVYHQICLLKTNNLSKAWLICKQEIYNSEKLHYQANF